MFFVCSMTPQLSDYERLVGVFLRIHPGADVIVVVNRTDICLVLAENDLWETEVLAPIPTDTTVIGLITNSDESEFRDQVNKLISWCNDNNLELNVNKTKEMIVNFRRKKSSPPLPLVIDGRTVEIVQHFKFLGSTISSNLKWEVNVVNIVNKAQQRL